MKLAVSAREKDPATIRRYSTAVGAFHKVSVKHLDAYLEELEFRFNNRDNQHMFRDLLLRILDREALRYEELTA